MTEIHVDTSERNDAYDVQVTVKEATSETRHRVTVTKSYYEQLTDGETSVDELVRQSFRFLLEREPKESILRSFDLSVISNYFPSYERVIKGRL